MTRSTTSGRRYLDPGALVVLLVTVVSLLPFTVTPTARADASRTPDAEPGVTVEVSGARAGATTRAIFRTTVSDAQPGEPAPERRIEVHRHTATGWIPVASVTPDPAGVATLDLQVARVPDHNRIRARSVSGAASGTWTETHVAILATPSTLTLVAPKRVVDGGRVRLDVRWRAASLHGTGDVGVAGGVALQRRVKRSGRWTAWSTHRIVTTDGEGRASIRVRPRFDHRWRAVARPTTWTTTPRSAVTSTRNVPPGKKVRMPAGAPRPRISLPPQARADTAGADVKVRRIPDDVWRSMRGVSWQPGCPVGRSQLRLVETNYYAFDGYRRRGRVVVAADVVDNFVGAFRDLHRAEVPIRSMRLPDRFGRSKRLGGADDLRSMAADNTSVFNCRGVVGQPHRKSPHAWGRSLDLNPWENPFRSAWGVVPNRWWESRAHRDVAWRSGDHRVVRILSRNGFRWTYGLADLHHFDAVPGRA